MAFAPVPALVRVHSFTHMGTHLGAPCIWVAPSC